MKARGRGGRNAPTARRQPRTADVDAGVAFAGSREPGTGVGTLDTLSNGFADPTRRRILSVLAAGQLCVCDIVDLLALPQPTVSRHLAYLRRCGLVEATRDWKYAHYRLAAPRSDVHRSLVRCVRSCFRGIDTLDAERAAAERRIAERERSPCE